MPGAKGRKPTIVYSLFFFNDTATTEIYTLSLHDALPICQAGPDGEGGAQVDGVQGTDRDGPDGLGQDADAGAQVDQVDLVQHGMQPGYRLRRLPGQGSERLDLHQDGADPPGFGSLVQPGPQRRGFRLGVDQLDEGGRVQVDHQRSSPRSRASSAATSMPSGSPMSIARTARRSCAARSRRSAAWITACRIAADRDMPSPVSTSRACSVSSSVRIVMVSAIPRA